MYTAIIFDFFDVIHTDSFKAWLKQHGFEREGDFAEASRLLDSGHIKMPTFYEKLALASNMPIQNVESEFSMFAKLDTNIVGLIKALHTHYKLGLLSNSDSSYVRPMLEQYDLEKLFDEILISSEVSIIKPDPEIFHVILKRLDVEPANAIFIDDNEDNSSAAQSLGIRGIWYQDLTQLRHDLSQLGIDVSAT